MSPGSVEVLGLDADAVADWFAVESTAPYVLARMSSEQAGRLADSLGAAVRRCYVADEVLDRRAAETTRPHGELIAAKLPDAGSTMAGDFGEMVSFLHLAVSRRPTEAIGPLKWRLKQDRTKPTPHSDVVLFFLPSWPTPSVEDVLVCAEVKTKSMPGTSEPIPEALVDSGRDQTSRLARTLEWLRERALLEPIDGVDLDVLARFAHASEHPAGTREFVALAVIAESLLADELETIPEGLSAASGLIVLAIPDLRSTYTQVFATAAIWT